MSDRPMVSVERAREHILENVQPVAPFDLPLQEAYGCVLARDVAAEFDIPTFASSAMDGFAVRGSDVAGADAATPVSLSVSGRVEIGEQPTVTVGWGEAVRIATGAPIPGGADCVVPIEHVVVEGDAVRVLKGSEPGKHVRPPGEDVRSGDVLIPAGRKLTGPDLGMLASAGYADAFVYPRVRAVVLSTGNELIEPGQAAPYGGVRDSNSFTLVGALRECGAVPFRAGIVRDEEQAFQRTLSTHVIRADCFISTGGVSVGEQDIVRRVLGERGLVEFYRVAMQPGMPQGFGRVEGKPFFALPGNPVSVFVSFELFVRPALLKMMGRRNLERPRVRAILDDNLSGPEEKVQFARVLVSRRDGAWRARSTGGSGSNLFHTVAQANGLAIIPSGVSMAPAGSEVEVIVFRSMED